MSKREMPKNTEAEARLLNLLYYNGEASLPAASSLRREDFFVAAHADLFEVLREAVSKGEKLDYVLLRDALQKAGKFDSVGGRDGLSLLFSDKEQGKLRSDEAAKKAKKFVSLIKKESGKRRLLSVASKIFEDAYKPDTDAESIADEAEKSLRGVSENIENGNGTEDARNIMTRVVDRIVEYDKNKGRIMGFPTGFRDVDSLLLGIQPSDLVIIAARPSMGKTAFAVNIATNAAVRNKIPTLVFSMEMSSEQIGFRTLTDMSLIDSNRMKLGECSEEDWEDILEAGNDIGNSPLYINDRGGLTIGEVARIAREEKSKRHIELVIVDYIQLMGGENKRDGRTQEVSEISRGLKALAKELHIPVIALSQLSRAVESRTDKHPMLSDLRESGSIEQDADIVMFLYREAYYKKNESGVTDADMDEVRDKAEVIIAKNRRGEVGKINMKFIGRTTKFMDLPNPSITK